MKTLVIGASANPERYAFLAVNSLLKHNHEVVAIGAHSDSIQNVKIETEKLPFEAVHTVSLYLNPQRQPEYYEYVIGLKPQRVIFNPGTENPEFFNLLEKANIPYEAACTLVLLSTNQF
ncbi:CoA-binding protein [Flavobacterium suncheonense]|uniref:CoA-binding protein n=1 Tax=Flavobacterium suncheonense GH29-5 = DSM 17707 TaxID=1121899 RepID=A0A0A2MCK8_9FLAO|nr:CoA-binding protein [Flavobacterium suncheonense]KGO89366.1 CoA-binding protein [Flavobacterium suncheonense GH29-5 = DSM 17707]